MKNSLIFGLFILLFASSSSLSYAEELSLYELIEKNDVQELENAIKKGLDLNENLSMGETAFSNVSTELDWYLMKLLLDSGANPNLSFGMFSVLDSAVKNNDLAKVILLLNYGADVNNSYYKNVYDTTPYTTPLHEAVKQDNYEMMTLLLAHSASISIKDNEGKVPFDYFVSKNMTSDEYLQKTLEPIKLIKSSFYGNLSGVKNALAQNVDVNATLTDLGIYGMMPNQPAIFFAVQNACNLKEKELYAKAGKYYEITKLLIENNASINSVDIVGYSLLHWAARGGNVEIINYLLEKGLEPNLKSKAGISPLMLAAESGNIEAIRLLLDKGSIINQSDISRGWTALDYAVHNNQDEAIDLLKQYGALSAN